MEQNRIFRLVIAVLSSILSFTCIFAQDMPKEVKSREILISYTDSLLKFNILSKPLNKEAKSNLLYYWFGSEILHVNRGGYAGNLLDGKYLVFDKKMRLRIEGFFKEGLKTGIWKSWRESGELMSIIKWEKGQKEGKAQFFDNNGKLLKSCNYSDDLLDGTTIVYRGNSIEKIKYRDGIEMKKPLPREKKPAKRVKTPIKSNDTKGDSAVKSKKIFEKLFSKKPDPSGKKMTDKKADKNENQVIRNNSTVAGKDSVSTKSGNLFTKIFKKRKSSSTKKVRDNKQKDTMLDNNSKRTTPRGDSK